MKNAKSNNTFLEAFAKLKKLYIELGKRIEEVEGLTEFNRLAAMNSALKIYESSEKLTLLARVLPVYSGNIIAADKVEEIKEKLILVKIGYTEEGWLCVKLFALLPKKEHGGTQYIRDSLYPEMQKFFEDKPLRKNKKSVLIFRHIYDKRRPEREMRDHDNIEVNAVSDILALFALPDDSPKYCNHYYCSAAGSEDRCEVYVVPETDFAKWLENEKLMPETGIKLLPRPP